MNLKAVLAVAIAVYATSAQAQIVDTKAGLRNFIESFVLSKIPDPIGDAVVILVNSPAISRAGLHFWLQSKMLDAELDNDLGVLNRYQAVHSCLINSDCGRLSALGNKRGSSNSNSNPFTTNGWISLGTVDRFCTKELKCGGSVPKCTSELRGTVIQDRRSHNGCVAQGCGSGSQYSYPTYQC